MRVIFHGILKQFVPETVEVEATTVYQALRGVALQIPELASNKNIFMCKILDHEWGELIFSESEVEEIHVVPSFEGDKSSMGFIQIAIGALLIATAFINPIAGTTFATFLIATGISFALGGVMALLAPTPGKASGYKSSTNPEAFTIFGAFRNTVRLGTPIPIAYGLNKLYGHYLSFDVNAADV